MNHVRIAWMTAGVAASLTLSAWAQTAAQRPGQAAPTDSASAPASAVAPPADYVIGPEDVLDVVYWRDKDMSAQVTVRPDGRITLPLLNEVHAAGLTPDQLREKVQADAKRFVEDPNVTVVVRTINSRKVYITGQVGKPGTYPLTGPTTVLQLLAIAGGVLEFADKENITIMRSENGRQRSFRFNYKDVTKRKNVQQNIELKPGDTIIVP